MSAYAQVQRIEAPGKARAVRECMASEHHLLLRVHDDVYACGSGTSGQLGLAVCDETRLSIHDSITVPYLGVQPEIPEESGHVCLKG